MERDGRPLLTVGRIELGLAAVVLVATAVLQGQAPPASVAAASGPPPVVVTGHDFADTVAVRLTVSPGMAGFNQFVARVTDYDTGRPLTAEVTLTFSLPDRPDLGSSSLRLQPVPDHSYRGTGANLSIDGTWDVEMLIQQPSTATQIPLHVTTRSTPEHITVNHSPGVPDLYTITLPDAASLQVYLDPGKTGSNEFHATYVGADGEETPMRSLDVTATGPDPATNSSTPLTVRKLDSIGHFVADLPGAAARQVPLRPRRRRRRQDHLPVRRDHPGAVMRPSPHHSRSGHLSTSGPGVLPRFRGRCIRVAASVILVALAMGAVACAPGSSSSTSATDTVRPTTAAKLAILSPEPGATTGSAILLKLQLTGATVVSPSQVTGIVPTEGHIHVSVDGKLVSMAYGLTQPVRGLTAGQHTILASFVASDHRPFANQVIATVVFQVR